MKKIYFFMSVISVFALLTSCNTDKPAQTQSCLNMSNLDTTVNPTKDFYHFACGGWMKNNPLPEEYARYGSFDQLAANNQQQVRDLIEELSTKQHEAGSVAQKIGDLYRIGMDSAKLEQQGIDPIKDELKNIAELTSKNEILQGLAEMHHRGIFPLFGMFVYADERNSSVNIVNVAQGGLGMSDRDYYLSDDEYNVNIRNEYEKHLNKMFALSGFSADDAAKNAAAVLKLETALAKASFSRVELRNPVQNYNKITLADLQKMSPAINWNNYFSALGLNNLEDLNVAQLPFIKEMSKVVESSSVEDLKAYLAWNLINNAASYLNNAMVEQNFEFYGRILSGSQQMQPRWKRMVNTIDGTLGEAVGEMYVAKYFPASSKQRMIELVANLQEALKERITNLPWMTAVTKEKALEKLATFRVKIGYPDKWRDYSGLEISDDSFWANVLRSNRFEMDYMLAKAGKPVDKDEWLMTPQTVNAYYNPVTNEICFPAGILQPPFFFADGDDALNYGAIGVVIGHEMTHGFDDQGRQYDKDGNLNDWWTEEDTKEFNKRADALVAYFDNIIVLDTVHANGRFTLGENIADQGGLVLSYIALQKALQQHPDENKKIDGFTPEQRFYIAYSEVWAGNIRDQEILRRTKEDPHSLGLWRVNGTLPHLVEFGQAFDIQPGEPMLLPENERVIIW